MADVGQRVLISGMGGEIGSRVASLLENEPWVESLEGIDGVPPRRRLRKTVFHRIVPGDHDRIVDVVTKFDPHVLVHLAVWEPHSRANPDRARLLTDDAATSILGAAAECRSLESIVVRSGIEIYGRARGSVTRPDESARINPTSGFGKMLAGIELTATTIGTRIGVAVGALRFAPVIGPHVPSPLGRYLRMAAVPFSALADPPFAVVQEIDVAAAFVAAARIRLDEPVNVVAPGAITAFHAIRRGRRLPVPMIGPDWVIARGLSYLGGAPIPDHVLELMHRGRLADGGRALEVLGVAPTNTTREVIDKLYSWPSVVHTPARRGGRVMDRLADVISLPARRAASTLAGGARSTYDNVVVSSRHMVDDWGRDPDFVARIWSLSRLRWDVAVNGHDRLPKRGGALIVVSTRRFALAPVFAALSIGGAIGRPVRFVGRPDIAPVGPLMQRLGGLLTRADEIAGALRAGQLVVMGADATSHPRRVGHIDHRLVGAAVAAGTKVFPAATASVPLMRSARVEIGPDVRPDRRRRGPLTELELADALASAIQQLLDELGGPVTGTVLDWLPLSVVGGR